MTDKERLLAKCVGFDFGVEDHGLPVLFGTFEYEDSVHQGLGYIVDVGFMKSFLAIFGVDKLSKVNGKSCWVTCDNSKIYKIEPLHKKDGVPFDIETYIKDQNKKR